MEAVLIFSCLFIAATIGANDIANAVGTTIGANILPFRKATILGGISVIIGAVVGGSKTIETVGKGIVDTSFMNLNLLAIALTCAGLSVAVATYFRFPVSTTQSVVGALAGAGMAAGISLNIGVLKEIAIVWTILPVFSATVSFFSFFIFRKVFVSLFGYNDYDFDRFISLLVVLSGAFVAFSLGTNNIGNAVGVLTANGVMETGKASLAGGLFIAFGAIVFSKRVVFTIGKGITTLDPLRAFVTQFAASVSMLLCTMMGVPVSLSQAAVGSVIGVGLTRGLRSVRKEFVLKIIGSWITTPFISGVMAYLAFTLL
ncbi:MAG: inorganic phosphate transporter [Candidatus Methanofastidiosia archaeon]